MEIFSAYTNSGACDAIAAARTAVLQGEVICLPTDTVYGIGADPFNADAVTALLSAKSRTRAMPPPVLIPDWEEGKKLVSWYPDEAEILMQRYWPGALTLIFPARETLGWDLGETHGTVALRIPNHPVTLELLRETGPLAVTSANITGQPPATTVQEAVSQLGSAVAVYIDGGEAQGGVPSTILQFAADQPGKVTLIREGALSSAELADTAHLEVCL